MRAAAHPRSRGENGMVLEVISPDGGSSPLTRGKLEDLVILQVGEGLIPAHAGKTHQPEVRPWGTTAHPRSRGENT